MGTMAFSCFGVSGRASGSLFAAAAIPLSSLVVGIRMEGRLLALDIVFHLSTYGAAQADDPSHFALINKSNVVENPGLWCERDHARLTVFVPVINPDQRCIPVELDRQNRETPCFARFALSLAGSNSKRFFNVATLNKHVKEAAADPL